MTPQELEDSLVDYLYGELDEGERARFEAALPHAPEIVAEIAAHRRTLEAMEAMEDVPVPGGLLDGILEEAERRADARVESGPSFLERLIAGLLQPASLTFAVFFLVGTTGYFMVEREGNPGVADSSVAVKASSPASSSETDEIEAAELPELDEESPESLEDETGASESTKEAEEEPTEDANAQIRQPSEGLVAEQEPENSRVSAGTVARLVNLESDSMASDSRKDASPPRTQVRASRKPKGEAAGGLSSPKRRKGASKKSSKAYAPTPKLAGRARPADARNAYTQSAKSDGGQAPSVRSARRGQEEVARERGSINQARLHDGARPQVDSVAKTPASQKRFKALRPEPAQVARASTYGAPASAPAQVDSPARAEAQTTSEPEEATQARDDEEAELSPWRQVERKAAEKKTAQSRAGVWLGAYERFMKRGRHDLAGRALDRLSKVPGYAKQAKEKRLSLRKSKVAAPAEKKRSPTKAKAKSGSKPKTKSKAKARK